MYYERPKAKVIVVVCDFWPELRMESTGSACARRTWLNCTNVHVWEGTHPCFPHTGYAEPRLYGLFDTISYRCPTSAEMGQFETGS